MEGLNRPDNIRTNWNTSDYGIRELRAERSYPGSTAEVSRRQGTLAVVERGDPPSVGLKCDLQDGRRGHDYSRQSSRFARDTKRSEDGSQTHDDQRAGPVGIVCIGFAGKDHFPACRFSWDAAGGNSCAAMGKG